MEKNFTSSSQLLGYHEAIGKRILVHTGLSAVGTVQMKNLVQFAMCGSSGKYSPYSAVESITCQRILLLINRVPSDAKMIAKKLDLDRREVGDSLQTLRRHSLIKETGERYSPAFAIFTLGDLHILEPLIGALSLEVKGIVSHTMNEVEDLIKNLGCTVRGLEFPDLKYIIIGAMTLDYGGLRVLKSEKLLSHGRNMPVGGNYIFSGLESGSFNLKEGWMWGHNSRFGKYWFSTHGKIPPVGFRMAFPDIAWHWAEQVEQTILEVEMERIGQILEAFSKEDLSTSELKTMMGGDNGQLLAELTMLLTLGYVAAEGNKWRINRPFFLSSDLIDIKRVAELILRRIAESFKTEKSRILEIYSKTSPAMNNITLKEAFNLLYHLIFERALSLLMQEKLIASPTPRQDTGRYSPFVTVGMENLLD